MKIYDIYRGSNDRDVYIISEYIDENLHTVARSKILKEVHIKYIAYQLFKVMKYIHSSKIIHRDLKPSNILINKYSDIKLSDFALAKSVEDSSNYLLTDYMATRWYRAPEILLSAPLYNEAVDIWSIGCIIGELILGKPLFPGNCTLNQLDLIMQQIGKPTAEDIESINSPLAQSLIANIHTNKLKTLKETFPEMSDDLLDLISNLIQFNPTKRFSASQALSHSYFAEFHDESEEIIFDSIISFEIDEETRIKIKEFKDSVLEKTRAVK